MGGVRARPHSTAAGQISDGTAAAESRNIWNCMVGVTLNAAQRLCRTVAGQHCSYPPLPELQIEWNILFCGIRACRDVMFSATTVLYSWLSDKACIELCLKHCQQCNSSPESSDMSPIHQYLSIQYSSRGKVNVSLNWCLQTNQSGWLDTCIYKKNK